jgi:hypothetical protein
MGNWLDYDEHLRPEHLMQTGGTATYKISGVGEVTLDGTANKPRPVLYFDGVPQYLLLNDSNRLGLVRWFGVEQQLCFGRLVVLRVEKMDDGQNGIVLSQAADGATVTNPKPAYDFKARSLELKNMRDELTRLGGIPPILHAGKWTPAELEAQIQLTSGSISSLHGVRGEGPFEKSALEKDALEKGGRKEREACAPFAPFSKV